MSFLLTLLLLVRGGVDFDRKSNEFMLILAISACGMLVFSCTEDSERVLKVLPIGMQLPFKQSNRVFTALGKHVWIVSPRPGHCFMQDESDTWPKIPCLISFLHFSIVFYSPLSSFPLESFLNKSPEPRKSISRTPL